MRSWAALMQSFQPFDTIHPRERPTLVSKEHQIAYANVAKAASNTVTTWLKCRFNATHSNDDVPDSFLRISTLREPIDRAISALEQIVDQFDKLLGPGTADEIVDCLSPRPCSTVDGRFEWRAFQRCSGLPAACLPMQRMCCPPRSSILNLVWHSRLYSLWRSERRAGGGSVRQLSTTSQLAMFEAMLHDVAHAGVLVSNESAFWFSGQHAWPQHRHITLSRVDFLLRSESLAHDGATLEERVLAQTGRPLPPASPGCSLAIKLNEGRTTHPVQFERLPLLRALHAKPALLRQACALYYADHLCGGYELPDACAAAPGDDEESGRASAAPPAWLRVAAKRLLDGSA